MILCGQECGARESSCRPFNLWACIAAQPLAHGGDRGLEGASGGLDAVLAGVA